LTRKDFAVPDELGYLNLPSRGSPLLFHLDQPPSPGAALCRVNALLE
jgi:hypothetical protein